MTLEVREESLTAQINETVALMSQLISTAAATSIDPEEYDRRYKELETRHQKLTTELEQITDNITDLKQRRNQAHQIHEYLTSNPAPEYSDEDWNTLVDHATVTTDGQITITFKD